MTERNWAIIICLLASVLAIVNAMQYTEAAILAGQYFPVGNDSFYHARRILDGAFSTRGLYQFDPTIHVAEGSWLTWPWAYDYSLSRIVKLAAWLSPSTPSIQVLAYVPVVWSTVNVSLVVIIGRQLSLATPLLAIGALAFAGSQLIQQLHGLGTIDHHFIELTFTLLALSLGLRLLAKPMSQRSAIGLGVVLGTATAFHNALFILQLPLLVAVFIAWWRGVHPPFSMLLRVALALLVSMLLVLLPSEPFQQFQFSFHTHSWFHLYVASCTAVVLVFLGAGSFTWVRLAVLVVGSLLAAVPIASQIFSGAQFVSGTMTDILANIAEVKSPFRLIVEGWGFQGVSVLYSALVFIVPVVFLYFLWHALVSQSAEKIYLAVFVVFTVGLMIMQYRLQYFGVWAMVFGPLLVLSYLAKRYNWKSVPLTAVIGFVYMLAYVPTLQMQTSTSFVLGGDSNYRFIQPLLLELAQVCEKKPGVVLASADDGHYIRYHTDCSVIANNFLLSPQHFAKVDEANNLLNLSPDAFLAKDLSIDYVLTRFKALDSIVNAGPEGVNLEQVWSQNPQLALSLNLNDAIAGFDQLAEQRTKDDFDMPYARIFRVSKP